ncbi:MAG: CHASE2 domain-containing protein, partial [Chthoniobacterales bacterium]
MHWLSRHRLLAIALICAVCTGGVLLGHFFSGLPFLSGIWTSEQTYEDFLQREGRKTATRPDFVFLGIDQSTLELPPFLPEEIADNRALQLMTAQPFPWSREVWAIMLDQLFAAGARLVVFDLVFSPSNEGDPEFRAALERHRDRVVLGSNFDFSAVQQGGGGGFAQAVPPNAALIPPPQMMDKRVGYVAMFPDALDGKIRAVRYTMTDLQLAEQSPRPGEVPYEALSARAITDLGHPERVPRDLQSHLIRFTDPNAYPPLPLWQIFDRKFWRQNFGEGAFFKDKVVLIGSSAQIRHDAFPTPMGPETPGPLLHFHAMAAALDGEFLQATSSRVDWMMVAGAGLLAGMVAGFIRRPFLALALFLGLAIGYLALSRVLYDHVGLLLLVVPVLSAFLLSGALSLGLDYVLERMEKVRTRRTLERYVSKNLVKEILDNPASFYSTMKGARIPVTVLFTDLIGFTTLSERADPEELVRQLNEYLSKMV